MNSVVFSSIYAHAFCVIWRSRCHGSRSWGQVIWASIKLLVCCAVNAVRAGLERCDDGSMCRRSLTCHDGHCQCTSGRMTTDRQYCLGDNEKLLNDNCQPDRHVCLHLGGIFYRVQYLSFSLSLNVIMLPYQDLVSRFRVGVVFHFAISSLSTHVRIILSFC